LFCGLHFITSNNSINSKEIFCSSLSKGKVEDSDFDLFIVGLGALKEISILCDEASLETSLKYSRI
jgi:hypothetical protein